MIDVTVNIPKRAFLPAYHHLINSEADINLLWGGRDSGKSHFIAQRLIAKCLKAKYFRCILIKKTANTIEASQWQTIKDIATKWGVNHLFNFRTHPLSIECTNGNKFLARGLDDVDNIKSVKDPTDVWYEEMNQITLSDFITVATTLRSEVKIQQWGSLNPESDVDYEDFWIYKTFLKDYTGNIYKDFTSTWTIDIPDEDPVTFVYTSTHTTYHDNPRCKPERKAFLEQLALLDPYYYQVFTLGKWGKRKNDSPYCYCFNRSKHIKPTKLNKGFEVKLSFDFNVNPITCGVYQDYNNWIYGIEAIQLENSDIYKLCDYINLHYSGCLFLVTGDATGRNTSALVQDGINYYTVIKNKLNLASGQIRVPTVNPIVKENRVLVNAAFLNHNIAFDPIKCKSLIFDCENVSVTETGDIDKGDRTNPKKRADSLDHWRYYLNTFHKHALKV